MRAIVGFFDCVIVGARCAGATLAARLAQQGAKVCVIWPHVVSGAKRSALAREELARRQALLAAARGRLNGGHTSR